LEQMEEFDDFDDLAGYRVLTVGILKEVLINLKFVSVISSVLEGSPVRSGSLSSLMKFMIHSFSNLFIPVMQNITITI
jgi:hypothetical protein